MNAPGAMPPWNAMPGMEQYPFYQREMPQMLNGARAYFSMYPEIYYRILPFVIRACDEMDMYDAMPSEDMIEFQTGQIFDNVSRMYPDLAQNVRDYEGQLETPAILPQQFGPGNPDGLEMERRRRPRSRGILGDLIRILLISELFNRRRSRRRFY
jgi:hypothetical protein